MYCIECKKKEIRKEKHMTQNKNKNKKKEG